MEWFLNWIGYSAMPLPAMLVKLLLAAGCGGIIGLERTRKGRAAGIRTYSMVCLGATVVMMTGFALYERIGAGDPARLGAQVVSGIGFIGAGAILVTGAHEIKGLTTAAGLWATACIGLAIGAGYYLVAIATAATIFCVMFFGAKFQERVERHMHRMKLLVFFDDPDAVRGFDRYAAEGRISVQDSERITPDGAKRTGMVYSLQFPEDMSFERATEVLVEAPGVHLIERIS